MVEAATAADTNDLLCVCVWECVCNHVVVSDSADRAPQNDFPSQTPTFLRSYLLILHNLPLIASLFDDHGLLSRGYCGLWSSCAGPSPSQDQWGLSASRAATKKKQKNPVRTRRVTLVHSWQQGLNRIDQKGSIIGDVQTHIAIGM